MRKRKPHKKKIESWPRLIQFIIGMLCLSAAAIVVAAVASVEL